MALKIKSQSVFSSYYSLNGIHAGEVEEKIFMESQVLYNEKGQVIQKTKFLHSGSLETMTKFRYDENGNLAEETQYFTEDEISERRTFKYDHHHLLVAEYLHYLDGSFDKTIFIYDEKNHIIEKQIFDDENQLESRVELHYENNQLSEIVFFDMEGNISGREVYQRDTRGNLTEKKVELQGEKPEIYFFQYDELNRVIHSVRKNNYENTETDFIYDNQGNVIREIVSVKGKQDREIIYSYDENNLLRGQTEIFSVAGLTEKQKAEKKTEYEFYN